MIVESEFLCVATLRSCRARFRIKCLCAVDPYGYRSCGIHMGCGGYIWAYMGKAIATWVSMAIDGYIWVYMGTCVTPKNIWA